VGTVVLVHGLAGIPADVYLDGATAPALSGFDPNRVTDSLALPVGRHQADIRRAGDPPTADPLMSGVFFVVSGQRLTIAALLDPAGQPSWLVFPDETWTADGASLRLRHLAAAGPVTLVVDGRPIATPFANLVAGNQVPATPLTPGRHTLRIDDATTGAPLVGEQSVTLAAGMVTTLYLTGRSATGLGLLAEIPTAGSPVAEVQALQATPDFIATGDSGLAAAARGGPGPGTATAAAVALVASGGLALRTRRARLVS
jgi:hypothetical protein